MKQKLFSPPGFFLGTNAYKHEKKTEKKKEKVEAHGGFYNRWLRAGDSTAEIWN
jgi:hypothetical protein